MVSQAAFWDKIARKYAAKPVDDPDAYEDTLNRTRAHLGAQDRVLELGCGTGTTAQKLANDAGHITATDISAEMIAIANEKARASNIENADFARADITSAGQGAPPFDAVLAFNLLHLLRNVPAALADIRSKMKPGAVFVSKSGCLKGANFLLRTFALPVMRLIGKAPYVNSFSEAEIDAMIQAAGFEIIEAKTYPGLAPTRLIIARSTG